MRRRTVIAAVVAGFGATAGCGDRLPGRDDETTPRSSAGEGMEAANTTAGTNATEPTTGESAGERRSEQRIAVRNLRRESSYATLVVERADDGETVFAQSRTYPPGQERRFPEIPLTEDRYRVVVETDAGDRSGFEWTVRDELEGLSVDLDEAETTFMRFARCRPGCPLSLGGTTSEELPLNGSGYSLWYQPAVVVLDNPTVEERRVRLRVSLSETGLLDYRYRVPAVSRLTVPTTYRTGNYTVVVDEAGADRADAGSGRRTETAWHVPEEFEKHVVLGPDHRVTCGIANPVLWLENGSDERRTVRIRVSSDGESRNGDDENRIDDGERVPLFDERRTLEPHEQRDLRPISEAGRYELAVESDSGASTSTTWWACPPHSPITVLVSDRGFFLDQDIPR
ncbi:hypothetical protein [Haloprofundus halobius]|uniref:hypothetical protein n=1 Tax=Haloprofundus halobius TaxID=2876194 RepID=UPI001CCA1D09|nr:hypothetical protein [Haloprofundus halobius]